MTFRISVVIPVYNTARYLGDCIQSVFAQPEVAEAIFIDDGSKDNSLEVCHQLAAQYPGKIKVLTHHNGENLGSAAARNVGILAASQPFVAFIDSDDFFLEDRFKLTQQIFEQNPDIDGVYEGVKNHYEAFAKSFSKLDIYGVPLLHMVKKRVSPEDLLQQLLDDKINFFLLQGLCVKRTIFEKSGLFDPDFRHGQDLLLAKKMAASARLLPGDLEKPVACRRIHDTNITFSHYHDVHPNVYTDGVTLFKWAVANNLPRKVINRLTNYYYKQFMLHHNFDYADRKGRMQWLKEARSIYPNVILCSSFWKVAPGVGFFFKG